MGVGELGHAGVSSCGSQYPAVSQHSTYMSSLQTILYHFLRALERFLPVLSSEQPKILLQRSCLSQLSILEGSPHFDFRHQKQISLGWEGHKTKWVLS